MCHADRGSSGLPDVSDRKTQSFAFVHTHLLRKREREKRRLPRLRFLMHFVQATASHSTWDDGSVSGVRSLADPPSLLQQHCAVNNRPSNLICSSSTEAEIQLHSQSAVLVHFHMIVSLSSDPRTVDDGHSLASSPDHLILYRQREETGANGTSKITWQLHVGVSV